MNRLCRSQLWGVLLSFAAVTAASPTWADAVFAVQALRAGGCGGILPAAQPLRHDISLDQAAQEWATGHQLPAAIEYSGYRAGSLAGLHVRGPDASMLQLLRQSSCPKLMGQQLREIGVYRRGLDSWVVLAASPPTPIPAQIPAPSLARTWTPSHAPTPILATRALELINDVRARGTRCGEQMFGPAPPVTLSTSLAGVAFGHATDMAKNGYFEHEDLAGQSPADRVRAVGYKEKLVGENIAYGPKSIEEVVQGWLDSPGHCENIMDPRFAEMGIGYATGHASKRGLYWVQVLAEPRV